METTPTAPATQTKERHLTVSSKWFSRIRRNIEAPEIKLAGVYLQKLGFTIGSKVTVIEKPGEIIVRLDGASAQRDPEETADDRRLARKTKKIADYHASGKKPLSEKIISDYLSGQMSLQRQEIVSRVIDGEVPESHQAWAYDLLHSKPKPATDNMECQSLIWQLNQLPKAKRQRAAKRANSSAAIIKPIQADTTQPIPQAATVPSDFVKPPADLQAAEPSANPQASKCQSIDGLDPGRSYIRNVLRSLRPLPATHS